MGIHNSSVDQHQAPLWQALCSSAQRTQSAFYTPGHKRGRGLPAGILQQMGVPVGLMDLPELPELDNLFAPLSVIQEAQALASALFGAEQTWFLTNGSTCGILAALLATCGPGDQIIMPRNVHTSVISGLILSGAIPIFVDPTVDPNLDLCHCLAPKEVQQALDAFPDAKAIFVVYPTYEGICGDLSAIALLAHSYSIPLLVDEAHGPHFSFHPQLPQSALSAGADLTVQSTHKMLGALTQTAMLHVQGDLIDRQRLSQALQLVQSTSPNYILLASLDAARQQMALHGSALMEQVLALAARAQFDLQTLAGYPTWDHMGQSPGFMALDQTRITVPSSLFGVQGYDLDQILIETYGVTAELVTPSHLTFLISLGNTLADIDQLSLALRCLAQPSTQANRRKSLVAVSKISMPALSPRDAYANPSETIPFQDAVGRISAEIICSYPPGIPVLLPGERIHPRDLAHLSRTQACGGIITGCSDPSFKTLKVVRE